MDSVSPLKIIVSEGNYIINGGKVINFHNSLNFRRVCKDFDQEPIPYVEDSLTSDHIYTFDGSTVLVEVFLMASFIAPQFWVPSHNFLPIIDNAWIVRRETNAAGVSTVYGSIFNYKDEHMRFDSVPSLEHGYACNLWPIGTIKLEGETFVPYQSLNGNFIFTRLFNTVSYATCNNLLGISQSSMEDAASSVYNDTNTFIQRGNIEGTNLIGAGLTTALDSGEVPSIRSSYLEYNPQVF